MEKMMLHKRGEEAPAATNLTQLLPRWCFEEMIYLKRKLHGASLRALKAKKPKPGNDKPSKRREEKSRIPLEDGLFKAEANMLADTVCARELKELREEIAKLKRGMMEESSALVITPNSSSGSGPSMVYEANMLLRLKEKYMGLMKLKDELEAQLGEIGISLRGVEAEIEMRKLIKSRAEAANALPLMGLTTQTESDKPVLVISDESEEKSPVVRREEKASQNDRHKSGFRICKPLGTFLWPNMSLQVAAPNPNEDLVSFLWPNMSQVAAPNPNETLVSIPTPPDLWSNGWLIGHIQELLLSKTCPPPTMQTLASLIDLNQVPGYCGSHSQSQFTLSTHISEKTSFGTLYPCHE